MDLDELHSRIQQTTSEICSQLEVSEQYKNVYLQITNALKTVATKFVTSEDVIRSKTAYLGELVEKEKVKLSQMQATADISNQMQ